LHYLIRNSKNPAQIAKKLPQIPQIFLEESLLIIARRNIIGRCAALVHDGRLLLWG
jgi:hypothetical protein